MTPEGIGRGSEAELKRRRVGTPSSMEPPPDRGAFHLTVSALGLIVAAGLGYYFWSTAGRVELEARGAEISNATEMLTDAETAFYQTAAADGAAVDPDARCFFAPANSNPGIVCGPAWLGVSPDDEPWLVAEVGYNRADDVVTGEVGGIRGTTAADGRSLLRPDGIRPAEPGAPIRPATGPRLRNGEPIVEREEVIDTLRNRVDTLLKEVVLFTDGRVVGGWVRS